MAGCLIVVRVFLNSKTSKRGKLADAEVHFQDGPMRGLRLCGFGVWGTRASQETREATNVTFPRQAYQTRKKEKRDYMILRTQPGMPASRVNEITELILDAYEEERQA
jgi:hypothetical protein